MTREIIKGRTIELGGSVLPLAIRAPNAVNASVLDHQKMMEQYGKEVFKDTMQMVKDGKTDAEIKEHLVKRFVSEVHVSNPGAVLGGVGMAEIQLTSLVRSGFYRLFWDPIAGPNLASHKNLEGSIAVFQAALDAVHDAMQIIIDKSGVDMGYPLEHHYALDYGEVYRTMFTGWFGRRLYRESRKMARSGATYEDVRERMKESIEGIIASSPAIVSYSKVSSSGLIGIADHFRDEIERAFQQYFLPTEKGLLLEDAALRGTLDALVEIGKKLGKASAVEEYMGSYEAGKWDIGHYGHMNSRAVIAKLRAKGLLRSKEQGTISS